MVQYIKQADIFGRLGSGVGKGLAEQLPKEVERHRLASGLNELSKQKDLTPFQQFSGLVGVPGAIDHPQLLQSAGDLLRQQAIINSINKPEGRSNESRRPYLPNESIEASANPESSIPSATTAESTKAALNPYIPPSGQEQENMARKLMSQEPLVYPNIESARAAIKELILADVQQSNSRIAKGELEEGIQNKTEEKLKKEISTIGADIPGKPLSNLQQKAINDVTSGRLSPDQAKIKYGKIADEMSRTFSTIKGWGGSGWNSLGLINKNPEELMQSIDAVRRKAKDGDYLRDAADAMVAENNFTPQFAYAQMNPVSEIKSLNNEIKSLPDIKSFMNKIPGATTLTGALGTAFSKYMNSGSPEKTLQIAPKIAKEMTTEGSPLSIGYELQRKGYDYATWQKYLLDNAEQLNLTTRQLDELGKAPPGYFGALNDLFFGSFSGVK